MKIETKKSLNATEVRDADFNNESELRLIAQLYAAVPLSWDSSHAYSQEITQKNYEWLIDKRNNLKCLVAVSNLQIIGVHILIKEEISTECIIKTLWIQPSFRNQGLGSKLKQLGEEWAIQKGATKITTHVMANNPKMHEINKQKGFVVTKLEMTKELSKG